jgi:hypothetical protein
MQQQAFAANQASQLLSSSTTASQVRYVTALGAYCCGHSMLDIQVLVEWVAKLLQQEGGAREQALPVVLPLLQPAVQVSLPALLSCVRLL